MAKYKEVGTQYASNVNGKTIAYSEGLCRDTISFLKWSDGTCYARNETKNHTRSLTEGNVKEVIRYLSSEEIQPSIRVSTNNLNIYVELSNINSGKTRITINEGFVILTKEDKVELIELLQYGDKGSAVGACPWRPLYCYNLTDKSVGYNGVPVEGGVNHCEWNDKGTCRHPIISNGKSTIKRNFQSLRNCSLTIFGVHKCDGFLPARS